MMKKLLVILLGILLFHASCDKNDISTGLQIKIDEFANGDYACDTGASVKQYIFQDESVYVLDPGLCGADMTSEVLDENGNRLGFLGGIDGKILINSENFTNAVYIKTVWEN